MKLNTPLVTLLTGAALGIVLLIASMLQAPVKAPASYSATASPSAASPASSAPAAPASSSAPAPASASASPTATPYAAGPARANYASKVKGGGATIAISVHDGQVVVYICNGSTLDEWFSGPISSNGKVTLTGKNNATLAASYGVGEMTGKAEAHGTDFNFSAGAVSKSSGAGLYRATADVGGTTVKAGWIVLGDGTKIGSLEPDSTSASPSAVAAPSLDLASRTATYKGTVLHAVPVNGVTGSGF
jgi:serine/threonine-protein kinase